MESLKRERPNLLVECDSRYCGDEKRSELLELVPSLDHSGYFYYEQKLHDLDTFKPERIQNPGCVDGQRACVSNLVFLRRYRRCTEKCWEKQCLAGSAW